MGIFNDENKKLLDQLTGHSAVTRAIEEQSAWRRIIDEHSISSMAKLVAEHQRYLSDLAHPNIALRPAFRHEIERAYKDAIEPWKDILDAVSAREIQIGSVTAAAGQQSEWQKAIAGASGSLVDLWNQQQKSVVKFTGLHLYPTALAEFDRIRDRLKQPHWQQVINELAAGDYSFSDLVEQAAQAAEDHALVEVSEEGEPDAPWYRSRDTLIGIAGIILALLAWIRSEMIAASSDAQLEALGVQLQETLKAHAIVLSDIRLELRRADQVKWQVLEQGALIRMDPDTRSPIVRRLSTGEVVTELDHHGRWLMVDVTDSAGTFAGWVQRTRIRPLHGEPSK